MYGATIKIDTFFLSKTKTIHFSFSVHSNNLFSTYLEQRNHSSRNALNTVVTAVVLKIAICIYIYPVYYSAIPL